MARTNPLGKIKNVAVGSLKVPVTVAGSALGLAKGAAGKATSLVGGRKDSDAPASAPEPVNTEPVNTEPVNVTEELGLDPAPVEKPKAAKKAPKSKPVTDIDAAADPAAVDATPADLAEVVASKGPAGKKSAE